MKMKRLAAMLLAGAMVTGLCACGSSGGDKTAGSGSSGDELKVSVILKTEASEHWQLIKAGCDVNERFFESKQSPLHLVCTKEKPAKRLIPLIELLIKAGADPNQPDVDGLTPLMACNSPEIAVCLMDNGANPALRNDDGQTAYDFHMKNGYPPIAEAIKDWQTKQKKAPRTE